MTPDPKQLAREMAEKCVCEYLRPGNFDLMMETILRELNLEQLIADQEKLKRTEVKLAKLGRLIEFATENNDKQTDNEVACSASFTEALAYQNAELLEEEIEQLKAENKQLLADKQRLDWLETRPVYLENFSRQAIDSAMKEKQK